MTAIKIIFFPITLIFYYIPIWVGTVVLWTRYFFPQKGRVWESGRQFKQGGIPLKIITGYSAIGFALLFLFMVFSAVLMKEGATYQAKSQNESTK